MTEDDKVFYPLAADSQADMEEWMTILTRAIGSEMEDDVGEGMSLWECLFVWVCCMYLCPEICTAILVKGFIHKISQGGGHSLRELAIYTSVSREACTDVHSTCII